MAYHKYTWVAQYNVQFLIQGCNRRFSLPYPNFLLEK